MRILYILENYYPAVGGVETLFQSLAENVAKKHEVTVITSRQPNSPKEETINGVKVIRVWTPLGSLRRYIFTLTAIIPSILHSRTSDLIHTTTYNAAVPAWIAGKVTGKRAIITVHEVLNKLWFSLPMSHLGKLLCWFSEQLVIRLPFDRYIAVSDYTKKCLVTWFSKHESQITRIYNGIDYSFWDPKLYKNGTKRKELGLSGSDFAYLYFGRTGWVKGIENLICAVPAISKSIPNSKLVLILFPEPRERYLAILKLIKDLHLEGKIIVRQSVAHDDQPLYIKSVNAVIIPSLSEGFGYSAAEAMALGIPVVGNHAGSLPEIIDTTYNSQAELVSLLTSISNNRQTKSKAKKFSIRDMINSYQKIYEV